MNLKGKATLAIVILALALLSAPQALAKGSLETTNVSLYVNIQVYYTYARASYVLQFKGPTSSHTTTIDVESMNNLYVSVCEGQYSKPWMINIPSLTPHEIYNVTIDTWWSMSVEEGKNVLNVPLNPRVALNVSQAAVFVRLPPSLVNVSVRNFNYTIIDDALSIVLYNVSLQQTRILNMDFVFNNTVSPWLFKIKKIVRDIYLDSGTVVDYITVESLQPTTWMRQRVFNFNISNFNVLEVGDSAGSFTKTSSGLGFAQYYTSTVNGLSTLQVNPRVSLAAGERTTIYIKYLLFNSRVLDALPSYVNYADEVKVRVHIPSGSSITVAEPRPNFIEGSTLIYELYKATPLQNFRIVVKYSPPLIPSLIAMVLGLVIVVAVIVVGVIFGRSLIARRREEAKLDIKIKAFKEVFSSYIEVARRIWRIHEDYMKGRIKSSTYKKRLQELKPLFLDTSKKLIDSLSVLGQRPRLSKLAKKLRDHVDRALKVEEEVTHIEEMKMGKRIARAEVSQKEQALMKQIEDLKLEVRELSLKVSKATA
ncbi:MAG: hypothetical protein QW701_06685 [Candidatus Nezhaarchaeales archaeon]